MECSQWTYPRVGPGWAWVSWSLTQLHIMGSVCTSYMPRYGQYQLIQHVDDLYWLQTTRNKRWKIATLIERKIPSQFDDWVPSHSVQKVLDVYMCWLFIHTKQMSTDTSWSQWWWLMSSGILRLFTAFLTSTGSIYDWVGILEQYNNSVYCMILHHCRVDDLVFPA